ncbi:acetyl-CoA carboxylase biotin carboxyl carrier protein subunit [Chimaeribacter coloradensis]|uniref:Acetyl-CoA carboxylase biotin carboxyl carrier protein subunit n=1 Tax=Chimaeribacter coloradensis TaxID=2060068 RepID=A0A2N5E5Q5_9GAMM|nr:biotin/lipoyl-containing protein [Chimaeribacter coloradensis]PLR36462.1 acetyl-CoA carboxylase biotin carboxyl carrier protein subunit [Chimaeribacter coloradensis]
MEKNRLAFDQIRQLAKKMHASGLHEITLNNRHWSLTLRYPPRQAAGAPPRPPAPVTPPGAPPAPGATPLPAPMPGRVVLRHPQHDAAWVQPGQAVKQHELVALLKVGAFYLPLRSPTDGVVARIMVAQDQAVEFGSDIMLIAAAG